MSEMQVTMTELRKNLGALINRAAYGQEPIVLVSHGQPKAVIVSFDDYMQHQQGAASRTGDTYQVLAETAILREQVAEWRQAHGIESVDSVEMLRELREERDEQLSGVR